jgi:hypothetical protein
MTYTGRIYNEGWPYTDLIEIKCNQQGRELSNYMEDLVGL